MGQNNTSMSIIERKLQTEGLDIKKGAAEYYIGHPTFICMTVELLIFVLYYCVSEDMIFISIFVYSFYTPTCLKVQNT